MLTELTFVIDWIVADTNVCSALSPGGIPLVALGSSIFVLGGFAGREMKDVHRYDLKSDAWTQVEIVVTA